MKATTTTKNFHDNKEFFNRTIPKPKEVFTMADMSKCINHYVDQILAKPNAYIGLKY